ncbi:hypothetical protein IAT40_005005 [Kwoniella sp. CBS 6097]
MTHQTSQSTHDGVETSHSGDEVYIDHKRYHQSSVARDTGRKDEDLFSSPVWDLDTLQTVRHGTESAAKRLEALYTQHCEAVASQVSNVYLKHTGMSETELNELCGCTSVKSAMVLLRDCDEIRKPVESTVKRLYRDVSAAMSDEGRTIVHFLNSLETLRWTVTLKPRGGAEIWSTFKDVPMPDSEEESSQAAQRPETIQGGQNKRDPSSGSSPPTTSMQPSFAAYAPYAFYSDIGLPDTTPGALNQKMKEHELDCLKNIIAKLASDAVSMLQTEPDAQKVTIKDIPNEEKKQEFWKAWKDKDWSQVRPEVKKALESQLTGLLENNCERRSRSKSFGTGDMDQLSIQGTIDPSQVKTIHNLSTAIRSRTGIDRKAIRFDLTCTDGFLHEDSYTTMYPGENRHLHLNDKSYSAKTTTGSAAPS